METDEKKIGSITLSRAQKLAIAKIVRMPEYKVIEEWYRQRQTNLAVSALALAQTDTDLYFFKGKVAESRHGVLAIRQVVKDLQEEDDKKDKQNQ